MTLSIKLRGIEIRPMVLKADVEGTLDAIRDVGLNALFVVGKPSWGAEVSQPRGGFYYGTHLPRFFGPNIFPIIPGYEDFLDKTIDLAHQRGIHIYFLSSCFVDKDIIGLANLHLEYSLVNRYGDPIASLSDQSPFEDNGERYPVDSRQKGMLCPTNPKYTRHLLAIIQEVMEKGVDGVRVIYYSFPMRAFCFCQRCRDLFAEYCDRQVFSLIVAKWRAQMQLRDKQWPEKLRKGQALYPLWLDWRASSIERFVTRVRDQLLAVNPQAPLFIEFDAADFITTPYEEAVVSYKERQGRDVERLALLGTPLFWVSSMDSERLRTRGQCLSRFKQVLSRMRNELGRPYAAHFEVNNFERLVSVMTLVKVLGIEQYGLFQPTFAPAESQILNWVARRGLV